MGQESPLDGEDYNHSKILHCLGFLYNFSSILVAITIFLSVFPAVGADQLLSATQISAYSSWIIQKEANGQIPEDPAVDVMPWLKLLMDVGVRPTIACIHVNSKVVNQMGMCFRHAC